MGDLHEARVGDKLYVSERWGSGYITTVDRITPTGRVVTKSGEFNPDGWKRGDRGWYRSQARVATEDDIAGVNRAYMVSKLAGFRAWEKLSPDDLKLVASIVDKHRDRT